MEKEALKTGPDHLTEDARCAQKIFVLRWRKSIEKTATSKQWVVELIDSEKVEIIVPTRTFCNKSIDPYTSSALHKTHI